MAIQEVPLTIGFIVSSFSASYRDDFIDLLSVRLREKGYHLFLGVTNHNLEAEREYFQYFGAISDCIIAFSEAEYYEQISDSIPKNIPVIFLFNKPEGCPHTSILQSDYSAIYQSIISCANHGIRKIACICINAHLSAPKEFVRAYEDALQIVSEAQQEPVIYDIGNIADFNPSEIVADAVSKGCSGILASTPAMTNKLLDYLIFYNNERKNKPLALIGYGSSGNSLAGQMYVDTITYPNNQIADLVVQQAIYQINHPNSCLVRDYMVKSSLTMHTYNGPLQYI